MYTKSAVYTKSGVHEKRGRANCTSPFRRTGGSYLFFAAFFFAAFFFAICNPPFRWFVDCEHSPHAPAHSAAWHVGPGVGDLASRANSRRVVRLGRAAT